MRLQTQTTSLKDVIVVVPEVFRDSRGFFMEVFREDQFRDLGLPTRFVQDNHSRSGKGVIR
ncbi:MAG TPA: dTDP-4-dehydrorhamnose 3,5-epimerase family protein, partial [Terriglobales bacterium]|nr:dTDP-4-dehydrorhamnose 3,5-epimerase family protein [Terriglobales bacterium]